MTFLDQAMKVGIFVGYFFTRVVNPLKSLYLAHRRNAVYAGCREGSKAAAVMAVRVEAVVHPTKAYNGTVGALRV